MHLRSKKLNPFQWKLLYVCIAFLVIFVLLYPFLLSRFHLTSPDSVGLLCGVRSLIEHGSFSLFQNAPHYTACWDSRIYPAYQLLIAGLGVVLPFLSVSTIIILHSVFSAVLAAGILAYCAQMLWKKQQLTLLTFVFSALSHALLNAVLLTPHNLNGYILLVVGILFILLYEQRKKTTWFIASIATILPLYFFHQLSAFVWGLALALYCIIRFKKPWQRLSIIATGIIGIELLSIFYFGEWNPVASLLPFIDTQAPLQIHSLWDHPLAIGLLPFVFGIGGAIALRKQWNTSLLVFYCVAAIPPLFIALSYTGIQIVPFRFLLYLWIPFSLFGAHAFWNTLALEQQKPQRVLTAMFLLSLALTCNVAVYGKHLFDRFSNAYVPTLQTEEVLNWLSDNTGESDTLLALYYPYHHPAVYIPSYSDATVIPIPYSLQFFENYEDIFSNEKHPYTQTFGAVQNVEEGDADAVLSDLSIDYIIVWHDRFPGDIVERLTTNARTTYSNSEITIYEIPQ